MNNSATKVKSLKTRISVLKAESDELNNEIRVKVNEKNKKNQIKSALEKELKDLTEDKEDIVISEHAILRFIEREMGFSMELIQEKILPKKERPAVRMLGNCTYPRDGFKIKIRNGVVVTVETAEKK